MWHWPLPCKSDIPTGDHPGSFGAVRRHDVHTGVDLYCDPGTEVYSVENGVVISVEDFTGPNAENPWWHETQAILVEGESGVVLYGEVECLVAEGDKVSKGQLLGKVKTVLKKDKGKPMTMLHFELYKHGTTESVWWHDEKPNNLLDPTEKLHTSR